MGGENEKKNNVLKLQFYFIPLFKALKSCPLISKIDTQLFIDISSPYSLCVFLKVISTPTVGPELPTPRSSHILYQLSQPGTPTRDPTLLPSCHADMCLPKPHPK